MSWRTLYCIQITCPTISGMLFLLFLSHPLLSSLVPLQYILIIHRWLQNKETLPEQYALEHFFLKEMNRYKPTHLIVNDMTALKLSELVDSWVVRVFIIHATEHLPFGPYPPPFFIHLLSSRFSPVYLWSLWFLLDKILESMLNQRHMVDPGQKLSGRGSCVLIAYPLIFLFLFPLYLLPSSLSSLPFLSRQIPIIYDVSRYGQWAMQSGDMHWYTAR